MMKSPWVAWLASSGPVSFSNRCISPQPNVPMERHARGEPVGESEEMSYLDVAPTFLALMGLPVPAHMRGRVLP